MAGKNLTETVGLSVEDNRRMITNIMKTFDAPPVNLADPEAVKQRIEEYFAQCAMDGLRPGNLGMYSALGLTKQDVNNALHERSHRLRPEVIDLIKKGMLAMSTYREMLANHGKLNPINYIFQSKNFDGLSDQTQLQVTRTDPLETYVRTPEEIRRILDEEDKKIPDYKGKYATLYDKRMAEEQAKQEIVVDCE